MRFTRTALILSALCLSASAFAAGEHVFSNKGSGEALIVANKTPSLETQVGQPAQASFTAFNPSKTQMLTGVKVSVRGRDTRVASSTCRSSLKPLERCSITVEWAPTSAYELDRATLLVMASNLPHGVESTLTGYARQAH